ncbi:CLUMA_CG007113, isoform A [Clunio marinus]|uniref:CLUMA_CG007113, isoform A n=1 Tax=Clunio marinus TaxID=568069 RepID=A0A1J1I1W4_9DIPT|nr:CLUMA_CG007113, isoform A [Clunio marinus]
MNIREAKEKIEVKLLRMKQRIKVTSMCGGEVKIKRTKAIYKQKCFECCGIFRKSPLQCRYG